METQTANGWQNSGYFLNYAYENVPSRYHYVYLAIVRYSVGYGDAYTKPMSQDEWAKSLGISKDKLNKDIKWLTDNGHIVHTKKQGFIERGGSAPLQYGPVFPDDFHIYLRSNDSENEDSNKEDEKAQQRNVVEELNNNFF